MKEFQNILKQLILLIAISFATGASAFSSESAFVIPTDTHEDQVQSFHNNATLFFEEVSVSETLPVFHESDLELHFYSGGAIKEGHDAFLISEALLLQTYVEHKNKLLEAQLFPFHYFW